MQLYIRNSNFAIVKYKSYCKPKKILCQKLTDLSKSKMFIVMFVI